VSVLDGHPRTLNFLGAIRTTPISCLGVTEFGQSRDLHNLYEHNEMDAETIIGAALDLRGRSYERRSTDRFVFRIVDSGAYLLPAETSSDYEDFCTRYYRL
jgi:pyruvate dehydrogenase complex dehydrogenase (E1) component